MSSPEHVAAVWKMDRGGEGTGAGEGSAGPSTVAWTGVVAQGLCGDTAPTGAAEVESTQFATGPPSRWRRASEREAPKVLGNGRAGGRSFAELDEFDAENDSDVCFVWDGETRELCFGQVGLRGR